jgi:DNA-binding MarR family transcriptional regulator
VQLRKVCQVSEREDLGAQFARVTRRLIALEMPLLDEHELTMWEYAVLLRLRSSPAETQLELARSVRYDKTRLIGLLNGLEERGLLVRAPAPGDRRARVVNLTDRGRERVEAAQRDIHQMEDALVTPTQRQALQALLDRLTNAR